MKKFQNIIKQASKLSFLNLLIVCKGNFFQVLGGTKMSCFPGLASGSKLYQIVNTLTYKVKILPNLSFFMKDNYSTLKY